MDEIYEMPEMFRNHQLQRFCCTGRITSDHRIPRHNLMHGRSMRIETLCCHLSRLNVSLKNWDSAQTHSISQVFRGEYTTQPLLFVNNKHAVRSLGCTQLTGFRNCDILRDSQRGTWLECSNGAFRGRRFPSTLTKPRRTMGCRDGALPCKLGLYLSAYCL